MMSRNVPYWPLPSAQNLPCDRVTRSVVTVHEVGDEKQRKSSVIGTAMKRSVPESSSSTNLKVCTTPWTFYEEEVP